MADLAANPQTFVPTQGQIESMSTADFLRVAWHHSLYFQTHEITDWDEFEHAITTLNMHGDSSGAFADVMLYMDELREVFASLSGIVIAREFSECLYAFLPAWTHQQTGFDGGDHRSLTQPEQALVAGQFLAVVRAADELSFIGYNGEGEQEIKRNGDFGTVRPYRIRAWWD